MKWLVNIIGAFAIIACINSCAMSANSLEGYSARLDNNRTPVNTRMYNAYWYQNHNKVASKTKKNTLPTCGPQYAFCDSLK